MMNIRSRTSVWFRQPNDTTAKHLFIKLFTILEAEVVQIHHLNGEQMEAFCQYEE